MYLLTISFQVLENMKNTSYNLRIGDVLSGKANESQFIIRVYRGRVQSLGVNVS